MTITLNGTTGITTPDITSSGSLNIDALTARIEALEETNE